MTDLSKWDPDEPDCECRFTGDQADAQDCPLHGPRLPRPTLGQTQEVVPVENLPATNDGINILIDPTPFNDMAKFFGAAGTVMMLLQTRGHKTASRRLIQQYIWEGFRANGRLFCDDVAQVIYRYYAKPENWARSEQNLKLYQDKIDHPEKY